MELKEMVMMTLSEMEEDKIIEVKTDHEETKKESIEKVEREEDGQTIDSSEKQFYENIREKLLVIFEGFQAPNNKNIESKIDLTLNFLEYLLARIDERLKHINTQKK